MFLKLLLLFGASEDAMADDDDVHKLPFLFCIHTPLSRELVFWGGVFYRVIFF